MTRSLARIAAMMFALVAGLAGAAAEEQPSSSARKALKHPSARGSWLVNRESKERILHDPRATIHDPRSSAEVRLRAALALAKDNDAESIPVLIDLLAELPREQRQEAEDYLRQLAGEWTPIDRTLSEDEIGRRIRRDAWAAWWRATDGPALLAEVRRLTPAADAAEKARALIAKLPDEHFAAREAAIQKLLALGRSALPSLREAARGSELPAAHQAQALIERIERDPAQRLPLAVLRLLPVRKPAEAAAALLAYLPAAEDDTHAAEARKALAALALREGKPEPTLLRALADDKAEVRATAAEALIQGGAAGRAAIRKLLHSDKPAIRLRIALALGRAGQRDGVEALIDLLAVLPEDEAGQAEEALCQLAGDTAPEVESGNDVTARKKNRDAWAAWWKANAARVDLTRLRAPLSLGYTLICDNANNRVFEIDRRGKERWAIEGLSYPIDACMLPGNRVLIAEYRGMRVTERDLKGNIVWQMQVAGRPVSVQRLRNGHTLIGTMTSGIVEVDRAGKEVASFKGMVGGVQAAYRTRKGITVYLTRNGQCVLLDAAGKQLKSFAVGGGLGNMGRLDVRPDGHIFVAPGGRRLGNKVVEYDGDGKKLHEWDAADATTATPLANGHVLIASANSQRVYELNRAGKVVWEHRGGSPFRARRR